MFMLHGLLSKKLASWFFKTKNQCVKCFSMIYKHDYSTKGY